MSKAGGHGHAPKGRRPKKHEEEEHENHERWLVSYADMVTLLMCLFIVLYAISQVDKQKFAALASWANFLVSTWLSANSTMNRHMSRVIMSA